MKLGFIGTGKITSSVVTGICRSKISFNKIILSPRSKSNTIAYNKVASEENEKLVREFFTSTLLN